jgi:hypothetical protein
MRVLSKSSIAATVSAAVLGLGLGVSAPAVAASRVPHGQVAFDRNHNIGIGAGRHGSIYGDDEYGYYGPYGPYGYYGPGVLGGLGLAAGAIIGAATAPFEYGYAGPYYNGGCYQYRPSYDQFGNYVGDQLVDICG